MKYLSYKLKFLLFAIFLIHCTYSSAQQVITGSVKDTEGQPLAGATIAVRGTTISTKADSIGQFRLNVKQEAPFFIRATFIGFKPQDFQILKIDNTPIQLQLVDDALLEEIVVTSRRRSEVLQDVPIPISVVGRAQIEESGSFNVTRTNSISSDVYLQSKKYRG